MPATKAELDALRRVATPLRMSQALGVGQSPHLTLAEQVLGRPYQIYDWVLHLEREVLGMLSRPGREIMLVSVPPQEGKALSVDTPIPTPDGWTSMGALRDGDVVLDHAGSPTVVLKAHAPYEAELWEVRFEDGTSIHCDADHLWHLVSRDVATYRQGGAKWTDAWPEVGKTMTTREAAARQDRPDKGGRWRVPVGRIESSDVDLPVDPYLLGYWLGDGHTASGRITCGTVDLSHVQGIGEVQSMSEPRPGVHLVQYRGLTSALRAAGVLHHKHIPAQYLRAGTEQRRRLLAGLLDSDGGMSGPSVEIAQQSKELAAGIRELAVSLGAVVRQAERPSRLHGRDTGATTYRQTIVSTFNPFALERKAAGWAAQAAKARWSQRSQRVIASIKPTGVVSAVRCITVDSASSLYLAGESMIPTHNTTYCGMFLPAWYIGLNPSHQVLFISYNDEYATGWGLRTQNVLKHFGQDLFGTSLSRQQSGAGNWKTQGDIGGMLSTGILGGITGNPGHLIIIDDVIKTMEEAGSAAVKRKHLDEWDNSIQTRFQENTKVIIVATRWAVDDLSGSIYARSLEPDYAGPPVHYVNIQAMAEPEDEQVEKMSKRARKRWTDPLGRHEGEYLKGQHSPEFFKEKQNTPGMDHTWNCLYQGTPTRRTGSMFPRAKWRRYDPSEGVMPDFVSRVRVWDVASTENGGDWTVGALWAKTADQDFYLLDLQRFRHNPSGVKERIKEQAKSDTYRVPIRMEEERDGAGKSVISFYTDELIGYDFDGIREPGTKTQRATPYSQFQNGGKCFLPKGEGFEWVEAFMDEHGQMMGDGRLPPHDDQIDVSAYAIIYLMGSGEAILTDRTSIPQTERQGRAALSATLERLVV